MTESSSNLEAAAKALGIDISDDPTQFSSEPPQEPVNQEDEQVENIQEEVQEPTPELVQEPETMQVDTAVENEVSTADDSSLNDESEISEDDLRGAALSMVGEMLGYDTLSLEQLSEMINKEPEPAEFEVDERLRPILDFVEKTGRSPEDWFRYQQLDPSEMDDLSAVRLSIQTEYPDLTGAEVQRLLNNKYKLDPDRFDQEDIADSQLQLKIDAKKARQDISSLRDGYTLPANSPAQEEVSSPFDDAWYDSMRRETESFDNLEFDLPNGGSWKYGVKDEYRSQLINKNSRLEEFFDQYVNNDGSWNYDKLNAHQTLVDNIDEIVSSVYKQGLGEGLKRIVDTASNVQAEAPSSTPQQGGQDSQMERLLRELGGGNNTMRINI